MTRYNKKHFLLPLKKCLALTLALGLTCSVLPVEGLAATTQSTEAPSASETTLQQAASQIKLQQLGEDSIPEDEAERILYIQEHDTVDENDPGEGDPEYQKYQEMVEREESESDISGLDLTGSVLTIDGDQSIVLPGQISEVKDLAAATTINVTSKTIYSPFGKLNYNTTNKAYTLDFTGKLSYGIDVSHHQGTIDWQKVKNSGVEYVYVRCGYRSMDAGTLNKDRQWEANIEGALNAGFKVGVYFFSQALTTAEAVAEANYTLKLIGDRLEQLDLPICFDQEAPSGGRFDKANLSKTTCTKLAKAFVTTIQNAGANASSYGGHNKFLREQDYEELQNMGCAIWYARYNTYTGVSVASDTGMHNMKYYMWQYDASKAVSGISTYVDVNFVVIDHLPKVNRIIPDVQCAFTEDEGPSTVTAKSLSTGVQLDWEGIEGAMGYVIRRSTDGTNWELVGDIHSGTELTWTDTDVKTAQIYQYQICAVLAEDGYTRSQYGATVYGVKKPATPSASSTVSANSSLGNQVAWNKVTGADGYIIRRRVAGSEDSWETLADLTTTSYLDKTAEFGVTYNYNVCAYIQLPDGTLAKGNYKKILLTRVPGTSTLVSVEEESDDALTLMWTPVSEASGYRILRCAKGGSYEAIADVEAGSPANLMSYEDDTVALGVTYNYKVQVYVQKAVAEGEPESKVYGDYSNELGDRIIPGVALPVSLTSAGYSSLRLTWQPVEGASGYYIYRVMSDGSRKKVGEASATATSYKITGLTCGTSYSYTARAYVLVNGSKVLGEVCALELSAKPSLGTPATTVTSPSKGKAAVTWTKVSGASGYLIYYKTSETGAKKTLAKVSSTSTRYRTVEGRSGRYCYYAVRAYRIVNGKRVYSKYTWVKKKIK